MVSSDPTESYPLEQITASIYYLRGQKVMLDRDLASLYGIETRELVQAVKRNPDRFPDDFMFQLDKDEFEHWRSQIVISNASAKMGVRRPPYVFTEQGVAMLSSVLKSKRAVQVNVEIMRTFVRLRQLLASNEDLSNKIIEMERRYDSHFKTVFDALRQLMMPPEKERRPIGFRSASPSEHEHPKESS